jgi:hypothetical protein
MDRRTLLPAGLVALLVALTFWILPAIDEQVSLDDPIGAGDVIQVGQNVQFDPATGWNLESGLRAGTSTSGNYPESSTLTKDGVTFTVTTGSFDGTPRDLLDQLKKNNDKFGPDAADIQTGDLSSFQTAGGLSGVIARFTTTASDGLLAALSVDGDGIEVSVYGPASLPSDPELEREIVAMLRSINLVEGATS